jgi:5-methyltetrahydrofolate--homocysteine methyltransferase
LLNGDGETDIKQELSEKYRQLREEYTQEKEQLLTLEEARKNKLNLFNE